MELEFDISATFFFLLNEIINFWSVRTISITGHLNELFVCLISVN